MLWQWLLWIGIFVLAASAFAFVKGRKTWLGPDSNRAPLIFLDVLALAAIVSSLVGIFGPANSYIAQAKAAARAQHLRVYDIEWGDGVYAIGKGCTVDADLSHGKLVFKDVKPVLVLTPTVVDAICASQLWSEQGP